LFGHVKGAFTGAMKDRIGRVEAAEGGTLFLDEIGELELSLQAKLLRVLEEGCFRRVGGLKDLPLDVRVIAASNRDLKAEGEAGRFRSDLFYRLAVIQIDIPPLRERGDDVGLLAQHYMSSFRKRLRKNIACIAPEALAAFASYEWPGNVRELRNVIERAMILEDGDEITAKYLPRGLAVESRTGSETHAESRTLDQFRLPGDGLSLEEVEMSLVRQALKRSGGNQTKAAELLDISRDQLRYRMKKLEEVAVAANEPE
jgi:two-component system NtrC family response regulator